MLELDNAPNRLLAMLASAIPKGLGAKQSSLFCPGGETGRLTTLRW